VDDVLKKQDLHQQKEAGLIAIKLLLKNIIKIQHNSACLPCYQIGPSSK